MVEYTMNDMIEIFKDAKEFRARYVAVKILMDGFPKPEIIVNEFDNIDSKLEYYKNTYDEYLNHKYAKGIKIIDYSYGNTLNEISRRFN